MPLRRHPYRLMKILLTTLLLTLTTLSNAQDRACREILLDILREETSSGRISREIADFLEDETGLRSLRFYFEDFYRYGADTYDIRTKLARINPNNNLETELNRIFTADEIDFIWNAAIRFMREDRLHKELLQLVKKNNKIAALIYYTPKGELRKTVSREVLQLLKEGEGPDQIFNILKQKYSRSLLLPEEFLF